MKRKLTLEFDEAPALVFVQERMGFGFRVYQDGEELRGVRSITIRAEYGDATTHEIEYVTGQTGRTSA